MTLLRSAGSRKGKKLMYTVEKIGEEGGLRIDRRQVRPNELRVWT